MQQEDSGAARPPARPPAPPADAAVLAVVGALGEVVIKEGALGARVGAWGAARV